MIYATGKRGCGVRVPGGIYAECGLSPYGRPVEDFIVDPPIEPGFDLAAQGVELRERAQVDPRTGDTSTIWHVCDWVGESHYPYPADFIEEVRMLGMSRRISERVEVEKLSTTSRIIFVHRKAIVTNALEYHAHLIDPEQWAYCVLKQHGRDVHVANPGSPCSRDYYATPGATRANRGAEGSATHYMRDFGDGVASYRVVPPEPTAPEPTFTPGIFLSLPIGRLAVVKGDGAEATFERLRKRSRVDVALVDL